MGLVCPGPRTGAFFVHAIGDQSATSNVASSMSTTVTLPGTSQLDELSQAASQMPQTQALQSCRATAFDQLFTSHFIESFGLKKTSFTTAGTVTWLDRLPVFMESPDDCRVKSSIRSTSMLSYGTWVRDVSIQTEAYRWYARALTELRGRISLTTASAVESTVCAAVMLLHFETWAGTSGGAWRQHVNGAASLIEAVGPAACRHGFMQRIFTHLRFQTVSSHAHFLATSTNTRSGCHSVLLPCTKTDSMPLPCQSGYPSPFRSLQRHCSTNSLTSSSPSSVASSWQESWFSCSVKKTIRLGQLCSVPWFKRLAPSCSPGSWSARRP